MRVRDWGDIVEDVIEADADPAGWRAVGGDREGGVGEDLYLGHPAVGVYQLKTYAKSPFEVRGVGTELAREVDGDLEPLFPDRDGEGRFAVQRPPEDRTEAERKAARLEAVVEAHAGAPTSPAALFDDVMEVLESPAFGPMEYDRQGRPAPLEEFAATFADAQAALEAELDELLERDGVGRGFQ